MFKRELKINFKSFFCTTLVMLLIYLISFIIYPSITKNAADIDNMVKSLPPEMLKTFNMDSISISTISGWIKTEGYMIVTLVGSIYFGILGSSILLKEENDGTINFLATRPIKRNKIVIFKMLSGIFYIILFN